MPFDGIKTPLGSFPSPFGSQSGTMAQQFAKGKPNVLSWTFDDPAGDMGSVWIADTVTPANNFNSSVSSAILAKFTGWSATSPMIVRGRDGTLKYAPHNLFLNSDAPATQSIATVVGLKYKVILTGSGSIALSGAGSGTVTDGSPVEITASTTSLTCTVSGSPTTAQVVNSPCHDGYVSAAGSAKFTIPTTYDTSGNKLGFLDWEARTNAAWWSRDLTQSAHVKTNATAYKTARGTDNELNSASRLVATAANGSVIQTITAASAQRVSSAKVRRSKGSGTVKMSQGETTGSEKVTNGTFAADTNWTKTNTTISGGVLNFSGTASANAYQDCLTVGKLHKVTLTVTRSAGTLKVLQSGAGYGIGLDITAGGTYSAYFICSESARFYLLTSDGFTGTVDDVSVLECTETTLSLNAVSYAEVSGTELVTNGGFDADASWTKETNWSISGGAASKTASGGGGSTSLSQGTTSVAGKLYKLTYDVTALAGSGGSQVYLGGAVFGAPTGLGAQEAYAVAAANNATLAFNFADTRSVTIDNISIKEVEPSQAWTEAKTAAATITNPCVAIWSDTSGDVLDIDHVQCEVPTNGGAAGPPIITAGAAVTRSAGQLGISSSLFNVSQSAGTIVAWLGASWLGNDMSGTAPYDSTLGMVTNGNRNGKQFALQNAGGWGVNNKTGTPNVHFQGGDVTYAPYNGAAPAQKVAIAFDSNGPARIRGGSAYTSTTYGVAPTGTFDLFYINPGINGPVRRIKYLAERLSQADMEAEVA